MIQKPGQSNKPKQHLTFVTSGRFRNIHLIPIDYGFRPHLRGRLTLRGLTLRRNPWTFGDRVSHSVCRYSCQHSHFRYLQKGSPRFLHRLTERSATNQGSGVSHQESEKDVCAGLATYGRSRRIFRSTRLLPQTRHSRGRGHRHTKAFLRPWIPAP